jgi:hypothetical protein
MDATHVRMTSLTRGPLKIEHNMWKNVISIWLLLASSTENYKEINSVAQFLIILCFQDSHSNRFM